MKIVLMISLTLRLCDVLPSTTLNRVFKNVLFQLSRSNKLDWTKRKNRFIRTKAKCFSRANKQTTKRLKPDWGMININKYRYESENKWNGEIYASNGIKMILLIENNAWAMNKFQWKNIFAIQNTSRIYTICKFFQLWSFPLKFWIFALFFSFLFKYLQNQFKSEWIKMRQNTRSLIREYPVQSVPQMPNNEI